MNIIIILITQYKIIYNKFCPHGAFSGEYVLYMPTGQKRPFTITTQTIERDTALVVGGENFSSSRKYGIEINVKLLQVTAS